MTDMFKNTFRRVILWNWIVCIEPRFLTLVPDDLNTQETYNKAVEKAPWLIHYIPVQFRTHKMCYRTV